MPQSPLGPGRVRKQQFMQQVLEDRAEGLTWKEIAGKHEKSVRYIRDIAYEGMEALQERKADLVEQIIKQQMDRLQRTIMAFEDGVEAGDPKSAQVVLGAIDRILDIKGLRAPTRQVQVGLGLNLDDKEVYAAARVLGLLPPQRETLSESQGLPLLAPVVNVISGSPLTPRGLEQEPEHAGAEDDRRGRP